MKGFRVSQAKNARVVYIYENVITAEERKIIKEYYLPAGYRIEIKTKNIEATKKRAENNGFSSPISKATKVELVEWVKKNDKENAKKWEKAFDSKKKGGLGFAKAKADFRKVYTAYPEVKQEEN